MAVKKRKNVQYVMCDTTEIFPYESYVEECKINGIEPEDEDSSDYWEWVGETQTRYYQDELLNLAYFKDKDAPCLITGTLGLWNGNPDIYPTYCNNVREAIKKCFRSGDDIKLSYNNGVYECEVYHHDGTNSFCIHKLSKRGLQVVEAWGTNAKECEVKDYWFVKFAEV